MVGNDAQRGVRGVFDTGDLSGSVEQVLEQVDLVVAVHVLQHGSQALQTHAGIDRGLGQRDQFAAGLAVVLHENQVPDFDVTVAVFVGAAGWATSDIGAVIEEYFGTGTTGAGIAHLPEVGVVAQAHNAIHGDTDLFCPDLGGFVIVLVDGDPEFVFGQLQGLCQKVPGIANGVLLEVIAKAEVTQHFKKGVVTGGVTDIFQVVVLATGAHTALGAGGTGVAA